MGGVFRGRQGHRILPPADYGSAAAAYDPAALNLTSWVRGSYTGSPWLGTASAGISGNGGTDYVAGTAPAVGTAVNAKDPASLNGTTHFLAGEGLMSDYFTDTLYSAVILVKPTAPAAPSGVEINDDPLLGDNGGNWGIVYTTSGVQGVHADPTYRLTGNVAITADAWSMVSLILTGGTLSLRVNNGAAATVAAGALAGIGAQLVQIGKNYATARPAFDCLEVMTSKVSLAANLADIKSYFNSRYGLSL